MTEYKATPKTQSISWKGGKYAGELKNGLPHGRGKFKLPDGTSYMGDWQEGKPHGRVAATYADGSSYKGDFYKGIRHGYGILTTPEGKIFKGLWEKGQFVESIDQPDRAAGGPAAAERPPGRTGPAHRDPAGPGYSVLCSGHGRHVGAQFQPG